MTKLKYLFEAELIGGTIYKQNPQDRSVKFPPIKNEDGSFTGKSCFTDIIEDVYDHKIKRFSLIEQTLIFPRRVTVDLLDGHFEIDGFPFDIEDESQIPYGPFELIFARKRRCLLNVTYDVTTGNAIKTEPNGELPIGFIIGWQTNINGKNYQRKVLVH